MSGAMKTRVGTRALSIQGALIVTLAVGGGSFYLGYSLNPERHVKGSSVGAERATPSADAVGTSETHQGAEPTPSRPAEPVTQSPSVAPKGPLSAPELPQGHPAVPKTDQHGHPTFDCRSLKSPVPRPSGDPSIAELLASRHERQGEVALHALVIGAYYGVLGTNWYHLCDVPNGEVLVVSSDQLASPKSLVTVRGSLLFDYNLRDVYRFPIYIKSATLSGSQVRSKRAPLPPGVTEL